MSSEKKPSKFWEPIVSDEAQVQRSLELARRDIKSANKLLDDEDYDWAYAIAYNAMLQVGRALMFSKGFRPCGEFKHVAVVKFVDESSPAFAQRLLDSFDRSRKRRHKIVYDMADTVSEGEAKRALIIAEEFLSEVEMRLK